MSDCTILLLLLFTIYRLCLLEVVFFVQRTFYNAFTVLYMQTPVSYVHMCVRGVLSIYMGNK